MGAISTKDKSSAPAVSKTSGYASDASADFHQIGGRGDKNTTTKLDAAFFAHNPTALKAIIQHGHIYSDGQESDITWDEELLNVTIEWSDKCNLSGEPGLACSNGQGYAGWDDQYSVYLPYNKTIHKSDYCMRIREFSPLESDWNLSDSDDSDSESTTCSHVDKNLKKCGKKLAASSRFCLEHSKTSKKKTDKKKTPEPETPEPEPEKKTPEPETPEPEPEKKTNKKKTDKKKTPEPETPEPEPEKKTSKKKTDKKKTPEPEPEKKTSKKKTDKKKTPEPETPEPEPEKKTSKKKTPEPETPEPEKKTSKKKTPEPEKKASISQDILDLLTASIRDQLTTEMGASMAAKVMSVLSQEKSQTTFLEIIESNIPETPPPEKKEKEKKKKKDGPKSSVKGRRSSYIFFCSAEREKIKSTTDLKGTEITKEMGVRWSKLSDKKKAPFIAMAEEDKIRYSREIEEEGPIEGQDTEKKKRAKKTRPDGMPKKGSSGYIFFCKDRRASVKEDNPDMDSREITKELGRLWRVELTEEEKEPFIKQAEKDKLRYTDEKSKWDSEHSDSEEKVTPKPKKSKSKKSSSDSEDSDEAPVSKSKSKKSSSDSEDSDADEAPVTKTKSKSKSKKSSSDSEDSDSDEAPVTKTKSKSKKSSSDVDEEAPAGTTLTKKKISGYPQFCKEQRPILKRQNPTWTVKKITEQLSKMWEDQYEL
jgi:serine/arginine repetitive matrix protein 1